MQEKYIHIDVLFEKMSPEQLLERILDTDRWRPHTEKERVNEISSERITEACYRHNARALPYTQDRSDDELIQRYHNLSGWLSANPRGGVFSLLAQYGYEILRFQSGEPLCRQEKILEWRRRTLQLGQDLFTCATLAAKDVQERCESKNFSWPPLVRTDHLGLWRVLHEGMAENHYHLNGSTQIFSLSWAYLMNYPHSARKYFDYKGFQENLNSTVSFGVQDNHVPWRLRIYDAAWIRAYLFCKVNGISLFTESLPAKRGKSGKELFQELHRNIDGNSKWISKINLLRYRGAKFSQRNGQASCLDYTITSEVLKSNSGEFRLLAGERSFLYECFRWCFEGRFTSDDMDLFYLYIVIKRCFRGELIQVNNRRGFRNFSDYQDRKSHLWSQLSAYWEESIRLSVAGVLKPAAPHQGQVVSLELRVMPRDTSQQLRLELENLDQGAEFAIYTSQERPRNNGLLKWNRKKAQQRAEEREDYFYVLHFAKEQLIHLPSELGDMTHQEYQSRHYLLRRRVERYAKAIAGALSKDAYLCSRVRGIDACSHEIGCRPEVFATAFRYLRSFTPREAKIPGRARYWPRLGITYHVGEDFLDIADGLRAIDEALCFLNLERGDRLGHALALGIEPSDFYLSKNYCVFLPAQDLLDNLIWILCRSLEWNISLPSELRVSLENRAKQLLNRIYKAEELLDYFDSWKLRGDDPYIYRQKLDEKNFLQLLFQKRNNLNSYERAKLDDRLWENGGDGPHTSMDLWLLAKRTDDLRYKVQAEGLLRNYHFGKSQRTEGQKVERFQVSTDFITLIRVLQTHMMERIMGLGIAIESNLSSNVLIGTFADYVRHPIFRFNHGQLPQFQAEKEQYTPQLQVSINTDDQGVFDTSLENEYGLLYGALMMQKDEMGHRLIDDDAIFDYLSHLRCMGIRMIFPKSESGVQVRRHHR